MSRISKNTRKVFQVKDTQGAWAEMSAHEEGAVTIDGFGRPPMNARQCEAASIWLRGRARELGLLEAAMGHKGG